MGLQFVVAPAHAGSEDDVLRSLRAKRVMRCPIGSSCDAASYANDPGLTIRFAIGSAALNGDTKDALSTYASRILTGMPQGSHVVVRGFTDSPGRADYNLRLSRRRALAVRDALVAVGLPIDSVEAIGAGIRGAGRGASPEDRVAVIAVTPRPDRR
ncbi:outer membrane protein A [Bradyrhizobium oligotrophicum S58]|uniref:Outer membrane protein A n=2 Tax=Bradyrhizobium oligotrophicum TaxID=44255 RepID=M4Z2L3_9BRAD|nr:outer membrane protein A [Bradyrhizobium oligotrophicum S58]